ncbi:MAG: DUF2817 domain-containing protein [Alphaproteobacteria bacterium]|nr:DUF2817 domain-containing protein [Alphaproteobacteria bacterium]
MDTPSESPYRHARRAFIAACEHAHLDTVARLNPAKSPDGKPLFMDCAAMGPRDAAKAVLVVAQGPLGSDILIALLEAGLTLPPDAQAVLVHALDPAAFAGVAGDPGWPAAMLEAEVTEDLRKVRDLAVLPLESGGLDPMPTLAAKLPDTRIRALPAAANADTARDTIAAFFAT